MKNASFAAQLTRYYAFYTGGFILFVIALAIAERYGMSNLYIGYTFMGATILLYAGIGIMSRTANVAEFYVAGRKVPAIFNGMATASDWMSAASFIGLAGTLYLTGFDGNAFLLGWTGGYVLVALFLAPYLRKFGQFTIPDFLSARYGGNIARSIGVFAAILTSFIYVVAQIYGVGLITARLLQITFEVGVFVGLAGILVCSFLGGMRAVTWTQVAQFIILILAYMIPVVILAYHHTGIPIPQAVYGTVLEKVSVREKELIMDDKEQEARSLFKKQQEEAEANLRGFPSSYLSAKQKLEQELVRLQNPRGTTTEIQIAEERIRILQNKPDTPPSVIQSAEQRLASLQAVAGTEKQVEEVTAKLASYPKSPEEAKALWTQQATEGKAGAAPIRPHAEPFYGTTDKARNTAKINFLALVFCLMVGTAALPHILMRYYTTPNVQEARNSVFWTLFFIFLLYVTAPALAVLVKYEIYQNVIGSTIAELPNWVSYWSKVDNLIHITDINRDGILQLAEFSIGADVIVLATPEIAGLPYVISGLVAAGGLAAALSTADGLLLTIANALSHDVYYNMVNPNASTSRRIFVSKALLLVVAGFAAYIASLKPAGILFMVAWAFSLAAASFFPALMLGIFWKRANKYGAVAGMLVGLGLTLYYLISVRFYGMPLWYGISDAAAGTFGIPAGIVTIIVVSLLTPEPDKKTQELVEHVRYPNLRNIVTQID
ncbi:sodium:solute symporter family protein [Beggiatoa leptomitoformis]|uniref:Cation acetate symporter n=1 Tax=Beggiatoa leptomitoformis TaxID=288004 RepID=A0A2N9YBN1_9GAMM|nr:sodium:solute symporter family protein [Beggiatoa leptomitoformis]ALG66835.1 cation acetate symporter [Beggiatoa leptomitoformis]AUI67814.1 cation acetate symporter [Beggiatoa leptomitoformis]